MLEDNTGGMTAVLKRHRRWSPIWFLPILTLVVGVWLMWQSWVNQGLTVYIEFPTGEGMSANETQVRYKGIPVGVVKKLSAHKDNDNVLAEVLFHPDFARFDLPSDTRFWLVQPQVSLQGVSGLNTLLTGNYLAIQLGSSEETSHDFIARDHAPPMIANTPGLHIRLLSEQLASVSVGTPIYYRQIQVGSVQAFALSDDKKGVLIDAQILPEHMDLVHKNSRFWNASGVQINAGLSGINVHTGSLLSMLFGGIALSDDNDPQSPTSENGDQFVLHPDFEAARAGLRVQITFNTADGLQPNGTRVLYKGVEMGRLLEIQMQPGNSHITATFGLDPRLQKYVTDKTRFWMVKPELSLAGGANVDALLRGGYITLTPNDSGKPATEFIAQDGPDLNNYEVPGLHLLLSANELNGLSVGAPIFYKDLRVGMVMGLGFDQPQDRIDVHIVIDPEYANLVHTNTRFWNVSGIKLNASLSGVVIQTGPVASLLSGGITFDSPSEHSAKVVHNGYRFDLFRGEREASRGLVAHIHFDSANGLSEGSTKVIYRGMEIGRIDKLNVSHDFREVVAEIGFRREAESLLRDGTEFWLVQPELSTKNISGLETLLSGPYISLKPGKGDAKTEFTALKKAPVRGSGEPGLDLVLLTTDAKGMSVGAPILYKQLEAGSVQDVTLAPDGHMIQIMIHIAPEFAMHVNRATRFWNISGVQISAGLQGIDVKTGSLASIIQGGVTFDGPDTHDGNDVHSNDQFTLYRDEQAAQLDGFTVHLAADSSLNLRTGMVVRYHGVVIGEVATVNYDADYKAQQAQLRLQPQARALVKATAHFWLVQPALGLARTANLDALSGTYLALREGTGDIRDSFVLEREEPIVTQRETGLNIVLEAAHLGSLHSGDPVLYRQIKVGEVIGSELNSRGDGVLVYVNIESQHQHLLRKGSLFWRASGLAVDAGIFSGVKVRSESLETLVSGGIAFVTPDLDGSKAEMTAAVASGHYELHDEPEEKWLSWRPDLK